MSVIAVATIGSGLLQSHSAGKAADKQEHAAKMELNSKRNIFRVTNKLQAKLYRTNVADVTKAQRRTEALAGRTRTRDLSTATNLRNQGIADAGATQRQNAALARGARDTGVAASRNALTSNLGAFGREMEAGTNRLYRDRDRNIDMYGRERDTATGRILDDREANIADYQAAQEASLSPFQHDIGVGTGATDAQAYNLGLGNKPKGYTGLGMTPGAQFAMEQAREGLEGGAAARGGLYSGGAMEELQRRSQGIAAQDRDTQMAQMMGLSQLGQSAANSAAGIRGGYADAITGQRTGATGAINDVRSGYTGAIGDARTGATDSLNALRGGYTGEMAGARDRYANQRIGLADTYANRQQGINDTAYANQYGVNSDYARGVTGANDAYANAQTNAINLGTANRGQAGVNRSNLQATNGANYAAGAGQAWGNMGDAQAAGIMGSANALTGTVNNLAYLQGSGMQMPWSGWGQGAAPAAAPTGLDAWLGGRGGWMSTR